jgi:hypothetical protein
MKTLFAFCLIAILFACGSSTELQATWSDPSLTAETIKPFKKVLVIANLMNETQKRIAEDKLVASVKKGVVAVPSYTYLNPGDTNQKIMDMRLKGDGFDGLILMQLKDVEKSTSYTPGTYYGGRYGYYQSSPGYYSEDKIFTIETNLYSLESQKLLWAGTTSTINPSSIDQAMNEIIRAIKYDLQRKGLIKPN